MWLFRYLKLQINVLWSEDCYRLSVLNNFNVWFSIDSDKDGKNLQFIAYALVSKMSFNLYIWKLSKMLSKMGTLYIMLNVDHH